jgi:hypothetical protein
MFPSVLSLHDDIGRMSTFYVEKLLCIPWIRKTMCKSRVQDVLISKNLGVRSEQEQLLQGGHTKVQRCRAEDFSSFQVFKLITEQRKCLVCTSSSYSPAGETRISRPEYPDLKIFTELLCKEK